MVIPSRNIVSQVIIGCLFAFRFSESPAQDVTAVIKSDTVIALNVKTLPVFDGIGNDACWQPAVWQLINQVWFPWGGSVDSADYYGRYKVAWSSEQNMLYFLVEVNDDTISGAYAPGATADIFNFDMFEVFIDEDKSGGYHVFDGTGNNDNSMGTNAENAFAYHIFTKFPEEGDTSMDYLINDITGTSWTDFKVQDYRPHFPDFILRRNGHVACWEFSLKVFNDSYTNDTINGSRVTLSANKVMGLSLAYCDDDQPFVDPKLAIRDNFFGSTPVSETAWNDHWKNASGFGIIKLVSLEPGNN